MSDFKIKFIIFNEISDFINEIYNFIIKIGILVMKFLEIL